MNQTQKPEKSKSETRRIDVMKSAAKNDTIKETKTVTLIALKNTQLADGTFVGKGEEVLVDTSYAERVVAEADPHFCRK